MTDCPNCKKDLVVRDESGTERILCDLKNEGGLQQGIDIFPVLTEESYLKAYPEERRGRAFLEFCSTGDVPAMFDLLYGEDEEAEENGIDIEATPLTRDIILRYQDHLGNMSSGLHLAIGKGQTDVAWLLLLLASNLDSSQFPASVLAAAGEFGIAREDQTGKVDIRRLKDSEGATAEDRARNQGGSWVEWVEQGILRASQT